MICNAKNIAIAIINKCKEKDIVDINITKLHKLLYIVYGTYLYVYNRRLFDELPAHFQYGPIFKSLQQEYKQGLFRLEVRESEVSDDGNLDIVIDKVLNTFGKFSANKLSSWSHRAGSAWARTDEESDFWGDDIKEEYIKDEFSHLVNITSDKA